MQEIVIMYVVYNNIIYYVLCYAVVDTGFSPKNVMVKQKDMDTVYVCIIYYLSSKYSLFFLCILTSVPYILLKLSTLRNIELLLIANPKASSHLLPHLNLL